jgi:hypothetical protein
VADRSCRGRRAAVAAVLLASAVMAVTAAAKDSQPQSPALAVPLHEAIYHASVQRVPVRAGVRLERQGDGMFLYRSWVEPRGVFSFIRREVSEASLMMLNGQGQILPISYRRRDEIGGRHSDMRFDHAAGTVRINYRGEQTTAIWELGTYDVLSLRLVLAHDLARDQMQDVYRIVDDRGRVEHIDVEVGGREKLMTPMGELDTVRLEYSSERRDRFYRLWLAPEMDAALVRFEQFEGGRLRGSLNMVEYRRL